MTQDMTVGSPLRLIVMFTIPLLIGNVFQQLYNIADTVIVGRTIGVQALAAVGATGPLCFLVLGFFFGFTGGVTVITAQRFGAKPPPSSVPGCRWLRRWPACCSPVRCCG